MKAWHILQDDGHLRWKVGQVQKPKVGQVLSVDPASLVMCKHGLHASVRLMDALQYAPGSLICRVEVGGRIIKGEDKLVASERTIIAMADATETLQRFAVLCAREALALVKNPDPRSIAAVDAKERWLAGEITDAELAAAREAALAAAWAAAWAAAREAALAAARAAASDAAWDAARAAAREAALAAARAAAWAAAWAAQNKQLTKMVEELL